MTSLAGVRVLVAGAGLAGLSAARDLSRAGAHVELVEARDRLGGRVWTLRDPATSLRVEAGGEFIDGEHAEIRALARSLRVPLIRILRGGFGLAVRYGRRLHVAWSQGDEWRGLRRHLQPAVEALKAIDDDWNQPLARALGRRSVDDILRATKAPPRLMAMASALNGFYLADPDRLSALVLVEQMLGTPPGRAAFYRVEGGNDRLVSALGRRVHGRTLTRHVLRALQQDRRHVRATIEGADGRLTEIVTDYAIVTLPASTLRACRFDPPLPPVQQEALAAVTYGAATKAFLGFERRWWQRRGRPSAFGTNLPIGAFWEGAEEQTPHAVLTFLAGGRTSQALGATLAKGGAAGVSAQLRWLGAPPAATLAAPTVSWTRDPWVRGGYAVFGPRFDPALRGALELNHDRIAFAGEHTSRRWQGFMNGAVESGSRAAAAIAHLHELREWL